MGKRKITSLLVIAAAMLVALPTQAQLTKTREEVKAMALAKKTTTQAREAYAEFKNTYPLVYKNIKEIAPMKKQGVEMATTGVVPVGPRKSPKVTVSGNQANIAIAGANILASMTYDYAMGEGPALVQSFNTANPTQAEVLAEGNSYYTFNSTNGGGLVEGVYYGAELMSIWGLFYFPELYMYNLEDETCDYIDLDDFALMGVYDTATAPSGDVYGVFYAADGSGVDFGIADYENLTHTTIAPWTSSDLPFAFGITSDNVGYMIMTDHNFYKVDLATGALELIGAIDYPFYDYYQTAEIDQKTNTFYWLALNEDLTSSLVTVDLETAECNEISNLGYAIYVNAAVQLPAAENGAPAAIDDLTAVFAEGSNDGKISFTAPVTTFDGEELEGSLAFAVTVSGNVVKEGITAAGEEVELDITVPTGMQTIFVTTKNDVGESPKSNKIKGWFGYDVPAAPENVAFVYDEGKVVVTWDAVEAGVHEGFIGDVSYNVYRIFAGDAEADGAVIEDMAAVIAGDGVLVAEGITETEFVDEIDVNVDAAKLQYAVEAVNGKGVSSAAAETPAVTVGTGLEVPYEVVLNSEESLDLFTIIDANNDDKSWYFYTYYGCAYSTYNASLPSDDYLITPPITLKAGKKYNFATEVSAGSYTERFEVLIGKAAAPNMLTQTIIEPMEISGISASNPELFEETFSVEEDGNYYVAIHKISDADEFWMGVHSISISNVLTAESVKAPRLGVQPDPYGAENAVITVTAPGYNLGGAKLTDNLSKVNVYRDGVMIKSFEDVAPEDIKVFKDYVTTGSYSYTAVAFDKNGDAGKKSDKVTKSIGLDVPAATEKIDVADNGNSVTLTWKPVVKGNNGGIVNPGEIDYIVVSIDDEGYIADTLGVTSQNTLTFPYNTKSGDMTLARFLVISSNVAGAEAGRYAYLFVGESYQMPVEENFDNNGFNYGTWIYWQSSSNTSLSMSTDASDDDASAISFNSTAGNEWLYLTVGKIAMRQGNPTLTVDVKGDGSKKNKFVAQIQTPDGNVDNAIVEVPGDEYETYSLSLADYASASYVVIRLRAEFAEAGSILVDNFKVIDLLEENLLVKVDAPKSVQAGKTAKVNVTVKNMGENTAKKYGVKLFAGDEQLLSEAVEEELASFESKVFTADFATTIFDDAQDVTLRAEVEYELDLDDEDNVAETVITIKQSNVSKPEDVTAVKNGADVVLTWSAPSSSVEEISENFDDEEVFVPFSLGGITADEHNGALGDWTLYDGIGVTGYGFSGLTFENMSAVSAWQVFKPAAVTEQFAEGYTHSGDQCLISWCPFDQETSDTPAADHWLISPELPGVAQTISFFSRCLNSSYGEEIFEILYSTTDNNPESFVKLADGNSNSEEWTEFTYDLPAGAKFFAIRHVAVDQFAMMVDDITFTAGGGEVAGYNIYVDGEDGVYDTVEGTTYTIENIGAAKWVAVSTVMANGAESQPVVVEISGANQEITAIEQLTGNNQPVDIFSIDGKLIRQQTTDLKGLKGAYVINGQKVIVK